MPYFENLLGFLLSYPEMSYFDVSTPPGASRPADSLNRSLVVAPDGYREMERCIKFLNRTDYMQS